MTGSPDKIDPSGAGRSAVLGIDVGGTTVKARLLADDDVVLFERREPTPSADADGGRLADLVVRLAADACGAGEAADRTVRAVGLVVPGVVEDIAGVVVRAVNLGWTNLPLRDLVRSRLDAAGIPLPLAFGQDVRAGALAECRTGAAEGRRGTVAFVAIGTGLAAAVVADGILLHGTGWAGEVGQVRIAAGPLAGHRVEEIASAGAVARRAGSADAHAVAQRVHAGDGDAQRVWDECVAVLADVVAWMTAVVGCDAVVVGGGLAEAGELLLGPLTAAVGERLAGLRAPVLLRACHGDAASVVGAALMARELTFVEQAA